MVHPKFHQTVVPINMILSRCHGNNTFRRGRIWTFAIAIKINPNMLGEKQCQLVCHLHDQVQKTDQMRYRPKIPKHGFESLTSEKNAIVSRSTGVLYTYGAPFCTIAPSRIKAISSAIRMASSGSCVTSKTAVFSALRMSSVSSRIPSLSRLSRPEKGSY